MNNLGTPQTSTEIAEKDFQTPPFKPAYQLNYAIDQILQFIQQDLKPLGFVVNEFPGHQEDSGDVVSSESAVITINSSSAGLALRFFIVCGKQKNLDAVFLRAEKLGSFGPTILVSSLGALWQSELAHHEVNVTYLPITEFVHNYTNLLKKEWTILIECVKTELEKMQLSVPVFQIDP